MKETVKEFTRVEKHTVWQAADGTEFSNCEDCKRYEESALGVMKVKISKLRVGKGENAWELMGGMDDHMIVALKPYSKEDADTIMQFMLLENPWLNDDCRKELREQRYNTICNAYKNDDIILFGINYDNEYYFINSRQNIINNLNNLTKGE